MYDHDYVPIIYVGLGSWVKSSATVEKIEKFF